MRNKEVVNRFIWRNDDNAKGSNLKISGKKLINYATCIAYQGIGEIVLNNQSYSSTTRVHQNQIRRETPEDVLRVIESEQEFKDYILNEYEEAV